MSRLKVRFSVNKGRHGAPLSKLGKISEQAERFLKSLAADCEIETKIGEWLALKFKNGSVEYDAEFQGDVNSGAATIFARNLEFLMDYDPDREGLNVAISSATALEFARIGSLIDPDEVVHLGIYGESGRVRWRPITYSRTAAIRREMETPLSSYGAAQGILNTWFKESKEPSFSLRELSTDALIRVFYPAQMYTSVARAVQERTTVLLVAGNMLFDRATRQATELRADRIDPVRMLSTAEFEAFFGSAPDYVVDGDFAEDAA